jgi:hypothetical protein
MMDTKHIKNLAMSDNGFIFDQTTGYSYNTNELGFYILKLLHDGLSKQEIIQKILTEYEVSEDHVNHDFDYYLMQMAALKLIEE